MKTLFKRLFLIVLIPVTSISQIDKIEVLKGASNRACQCIDSIQIAATSTKENSFLIKTCIDKQVTSYQMLEQLISSLDLNGESKNVNISVNTNKKSKNYKKYYYELERYLFKNCSSLKMAMASSNQINVASVSKDEKAILAYEKGIKYMQNKKYKKALKYFKKAIKIDDNFAFGWDNLGLTYRYLNKLDDALLAYQKSLEIDPYGKMPLQNIPIVYAYKKDYNKAISAYKRLAEVDFDNPEVYYGIGQIYYEYLKEYEKSLSYMCKAYKLYVEHGSPYRTDAEKIIGYNYQQLKKLGKEEVFEEIMKKENMNVDFKS
jgi:tetratricopeptide (TPR) repeat protein